MNMGSIALVVCAAPLGSTHVGAVVATTGVDLDPARNLLSLLEKEGDCSANLSFFLSRACHFFPLI